MVPPKHKPNDRRLQSLCVLWLTKLSLVAHRECWPTFFLMGQWRTVKARALLRLLEGIGWQVVRQRGSHRILTRPGYPNYTFAFHDKDEIGPKMLSRVAKHTGLRPEDL